LYPAFSTSIKQALKQNLIRYTIVHYEIGLFDAVKGFMVQATGWRDSIFYGSNNLKATAIFSVSIHIKISLKKAGANPIKLS
jgi:hypothetical protein